MSLTKAFRSERGFTLAELLVACAIIALVMAGLLVSLQAGQAAYLRGSNEVEATQSVRVAIERMAQELRVAGFCPTCSTAPPGFTAITAQTATGFTIQNDWDGDGVITTAATVTDGFGNVRGEQIVYAFAGGALTRQETGDPGPLTLATGINNLTFTYQDNAGVVTATPDNIRTVVVTATTQPQFQPAATLQGRVLVTMTDSLRMRNR